MRVPRTLGTALEKCKFPSETQKKQKKTGNAGCVVFKCLEPPEKEMGRGPGGEGGRGGRTRGGSGPGRLRPGGSRSSDGTEAA